MKKLEIDEESWSVGTCATHVLKQGDMTQRDQDKLRPRDQGGPLWDGNVGSRL